MRDPRKTFGQKLVELAEENEKIYAISCDSASGGGLSDFFNRFPNRSVEVGISEQNAVGIAAAMSKEGLIPVLVAINPFLTMRAYEQIRDDLGYMNNNVKIVGSGGGLAYSTLGSTHIAVEDIALMRTIPNLVILAPGDAGEVEFALEQALTIQGPVYIRMPRQPRKEPAPLAQRNLHIGKGEVLYDGDDAVLFTYGPSATEALTAATLLKNKGIGLMVVNMTTINPVDSNEILRHIAGKKAVFTLEEHIPVGGITSVISEICAAVGNTPPLHAFAVPQCAKQTGPYSELVAYYKLDGYSVANAVEQLLNKLCFPR